MTTGSSYSKRLATIYDLVYRKAISSQAEIDFLEHVFRKYAENQVKDVIDLAAGTGEQALRLARSGYQVTAQDASAEMLEVLHGKLAQAEAPADIKVMAQRMEDLSSLKTYDAAIAVYNAINCLVEEGLPELVFRAVFRALRPGGVFVFDTANFFAMSELLKKDTQEIIDGDGFFLIRHSHPEPKDLENVWINHEVLRYISDDGEQWAERIVTELRHFTPAELRTYLKLAGFSAVHQFSGYGAVYQPPINNPTCLVTVAVK